MVLVGLFGENILLDFVHSLNQGFSTGVPREAYLDKVKKSSRKLKKTEVSSTYTTDLH
jgi:hypothetical protein